jgi:hypothetical protein
MRNVDVNTADQDKDNTMTTHRSQSSQRFALLTASLCLALAGCVEQLPGVTVTQSLRIKLVSPADPGSVNARLPDPPANEPTKVTITVEAIGPNGSIDTSFNHTVSVHVQFLGTITPELGMLPIATIPVANGVSANAVITLPPLFGATTLWVEDCHWNLPCPLVSRSIYPRFSKAKR